MLFSISKQSLPALPGKLFNKKSLNGKSDELKNLGFTPAKLFISDSMCHERAGKIRFSGAQKSVFLKPSSGEHCAPRNFVLLVTLESTRARLIVYLVMHQMK